MEFKIGASLWANSQESQMQMNIADVQTDFRKKLDFPTEFESEIQQQDPEPKEEVSSYGTGPQHKSASPETLYEWGLQTGRHLSFNAGYFDLAKPELTESPSAELEGLSTKSLGADFLAPSTSISLTAELTAKYASVPELRESEAVSKNSDVVEADSHFQRFFGQRWPLTSFSILARKEGLEVVVRDFFLSDSELRDLAKDLQEMMRSPNEPVEQIWINGRTVWQRARSV